MYTLFDGPVRVYLQGKSALLPINITHEQATYWIGSEQSKLKLQDFRRHPIIAASRILNGENGFEFADIFNRTATAKIDTDNDTLTIELYDGPEDDIYPTLWIGVLDDNLMPNYKTIWEFLRPLDDQSTAISVLLKE